MSKTKWNIDDPKQAEEALNYLFSLPDDEIMSEVEADSDAEEELNALDVDDSCSTPSRQSSILENLPVTADYDILSDELENNLVQTEVGDQIGVVGHEMESVDVLEDTECRNKCNRKKKKKVKQEKIWTKESEYFSKLDVEFDIEPNVNFFNGAGNELAYFLQIFDNDLLTLIVTQTNLYAEQNQIKHYTDVTVTELKAYIGCLILMGVHQLPRLENYWSSDPLLGYKGVSDVFTSKRFKKITQALHCNNNLHCPPKNSPQYDKVYKLRPIINSLNKKMDLIYTSSSCVSVDESMIAFKGRSSLKQYLPMKPIKRGYKVWCLADAKTGFVCKFEIYTGKNNDVPPAATVGLGEKVVLKLTDHLAGRTCVVAFDNFFTSVSLMEQLHERGLYAVGTVRKDRVDLPKMLKVDDKLKRGEFMFTTSGVVAAVKWQDSKPVTFLSTAISPQETTTVDRKNKDGTKDKVYCPKIVALYNTFMGGVDRFDQRKERYQIGRRSIKWWHRIFYFLVDLGIVNSFILYQLSRRTKNDQLHFRLSLARQLINGYSTRKRRGKPVQFLANKRLVPEEVRLSNVGNHFPERGTYRRCRVCSTKINEKRTAFVCSQCKVPACVPICFRKLHQKSM